MYGCKDNNRSYNLFIRNKKSIQYFKKTFKKLIQLKNNKLNLYILFSKLFYKKQQFYKVLAKTKQFFDCFILRLICKHNFNLTIKYKQIQVKQFQKK